MIAKLQSKPIWVVAAIAAFSLIIIGLNLFTIINIDLRMNNIIAFGEELAEMEETQILLLKQEAAEQEYLLSGDTQYLIQHKQFETLMDFHLKQAEEYQTTEEELKLIEQIRVERDAYEETFIEIVDQYQSGDTSRAVSLSLEESDPQVERIHEQVEEFAVEVESELEAEGASTESFIVWSLGISALLLLAFLIAAYTGITIDNRILRPIILLAVSISLIVIGWDVYNIWRLKSDIHGVVLHLEELDQMQEAEVFLVEQEIAELEYLLTGDESHLEKHKEFEEIADEHWSEAAAFQTSADELELLNNIKEDHDVYEENFARTVETYKSGDTEAAILLSEESSAVIDDVQQRVDEFVSNIERSMEANLSRVDELTTLSLTIGIFTFIILAVESVIATSVTAQVLTPIVQLVDATKAIENETYDVTMLDEAAKRQDEIGGLARMFQNMAKTVYKRTQELKQQVQALKIEIDQTKRKKQVDEIAESDFFKDLQSKASSIRMRDKDSDESKGKKEE